MGICTEVGMCTGIVLYVSVLWAENNIVWKWKVFLTHILPLTNIAPPVIWKLQRDILQFQENFNEMCSPTVNEHCTFGMYKTFLDPNRYTDWQILLAQYYWLTAISVSAYKLPDMHLYKYFYCLIDSGLRNTPGMLNMDFFFQSIPIANNYLLFTDTDKITNNLTPLYSR